jgi:7-carboxy-7-deazaguanine synthase
MMKVCEIFASIQGESTYAGVPCTFVRLTGCNLRCTYCDTQYAYDAGKDLSEDDIVREVLRFGLKTVEITGGEPLLQGDVPRLVKRLLDEGHRVLIETNGSREIGGIDRRAVIILDIKTPGSGMADEMKIANLADLKPSDELKFVIASRADYEWSKNFIGSHALAGKCTLLFSPVTGTVDARDLSQWIIEDRLEVRLNLQIHKYLFGPDCRGV